MGYKLYSRVMEDCKGALLGAVAAIVTDSNSTLLWVQVRRIVVHLEEAPSHVSSLVAPVRSMKDLWTHLKAVNNQELNPMVDGHMMARWDPMILEASIPSVPPLPMPAKGCGLWRCIGLWTVGGDCFLLFRSCWFSFEVLCQSYGCLVVLGKLGYLFGRQNVIAWWLDRCWWDCVRSCLVIVPGYFGHSLNAMTCRSPAYLRELFCKYTYI